MARCKRTASNIFSNEEDIKLIGLIRDNTSLWKSSDEDYKNSAKNDLIWEDIAKGMEKG